MITMPKRQKGPMIIAMADIAFLLIVFFLITVSAAPEIAIEIPESTTAEKSVSPPEIVIEIRKDASIFLDNVQLTEEQLQNLLIPTVTVFADAETEYAIIKRIIRAIPSETSIYFGVKRADD